MKIEIEIIIKEIAEILEKEAPKNENLIALLQNCKGGKWKNKAYYQFVNSKNPNQIGSEWQIDYNTIVEHKEIGTIIIDILKDNKIGGFEFYEFLD